LQTDVNNLIGIDELARSMVSATALAIVFTALAAKHLLADYVLQSSWMAHGKQRSHDWLAPLAVHAGCHGVLTTAIALPQRRDCGGWASSIFSSIDHRPLQKHHGRCLPSTGCSGGRWGSISRFTT
jgi:hypothetical protein